MTTNSIYFSVRQAQAAKTGQHSQGKITYRILTDESHLELFITIVANEGGGWFSNEIVAFSAIEAITGKLNPKVAFPTKTFAPAFNSRSVNNAGFLAAVLREEPFDPLLTLDHADDVSESESGVEAEFLGEGSDENSN